MKKGKTSPSGGERGGGASGRLRAEGVSGERGAAERGGANDQLRARSLGKAEEAREMFTKAYSIFLKVLGPDHPHIQQAKSEVD